MKKQIIYKWIRVASAVYFLFLSDQLQAQNCAGLPSEAFYKQTFGSGAKNPGPSLPSGRTSLLYTTDSCPANGYYTLLNTTWPCDTNNWYNPLTCCTILDTNGYFMVVNAPALPGDIYVDTTQSICGNGSYALFLTVLNLSTPSSCEGHPIRPRLTLSVETTDGEILSSYNTGDIIESYHPSVYTFNASFRTPKSGGPLIVRITNDVAGGCGNSFIMDDIFIEPCSASPTISAGFLNALGPSLNLCVGDIFLDVLKGSVGNGFTVPAYQWQMFNGTDWVDIPNANSLFYGPNPPNNTSGTYRYRLTAAEAANIYTGIATCRIISNEVDIIYHYPSVPATASSNTPVCINNLLVLSASAGSVYQWSGPAGFTSALTDPSFIATNNSAGQYSVIITDSFGCKSTATTTVTTLPSPIPIVSMAQGICAGDSVTLQASGGIAYAWLPANSLSDTAISSPIAKPDSNTIYVVTVTGSNGCTDTASVMVAVGTKPIANAGEDKTIVKGQSVILDGSIKDSTNSSYSWLPSSSLNDIHVLRPVASPIVTTYYVLTATSGIGCGSTSDTVLVTVFKNIEVPNAFSPNGDGHNDTWYIPALTIFPDAVITVYNRYGQKVFESSGGNKAWDGSFNNIAQPAGAYVYLIDLGNKGSVLKGTVILVR